MSKFCKASPFLKIINSSVQVLSLPLLLHSLYMLFNTHILKSEDFHFITKTCLFKYTETLPPKNENFQIINSDIFHFSALNSDCGYSLEQPRRGGSKEYPQSMVLSRNKKNNVYPCKTQFYYKKVGFKEVKII